MADANSTISRLGLRICNLEIQNAILEGDNEELRSQLAELGNRLDKLEAEHAGDLSSGSMAPTEQHSVRAEDRRPSPADLAHHGRVSTIDRANVPSSRVSGN